MLSRIVLFDLPSQQGTSWSLNPWKTRLILNYKGIEYDTEWVEYPDIEPRLRSLGLAPNHKDAPGYFTDYSIPAIKYEDGTYEMDSWPIAQELERRYPSPSLHLNEPVTVKVRDQISKILSPIILQLLPRVPDQLPERSREYYNRTREEMFGRPLAELHKEALENAEDGWKQLQEPVKEIADLLRKHDGPFFLGETVSYADFILVSMFHFVERFDEQAYQRLMSFDPAFSKVYEAAREWFVRDT
ncbi:uncharacterized protein CC84DRAFT_1191760 [Paraphaeosphaeria sporulosa]|uniref:Uncharacterized protein n=1 Tax=Paraphaeosphaeria sporulosa TaxID=1460663 RepID=A0A177BUC6_9PLEO|nr:uncharacterized protein CC84DRAFT_1191760 [Paraphaeosphaeria sporulosa]OAF98580.1 hypothetical protein CC84DRAFT_1191760 [Paraphaeosphaeria sporulosa]